MITSLTNDTVKYVDKLKKKASFRREEQSFVVEGIRMLREVPENLRRMLFVTEESLERFPELSGWCDRVETVSEGVLQKLSDTQTPQGMLAVVRIPVPVADEERHLPAEQDEHRGQAGAEEKGAAAGSRAPLILVLDGLQDPGNVGTLIRTAEAFGATEVLLSANAADPFSPKVVRSTMGSLFRVPIRIAENLVAELEQLKRQGVQVLGTHLKGQDFYAADLTGPVAILIGNEGNGLSDAVAATADLLVRIPMEGQVESLNAAISGSVVGYEILRQRRTAGAGSPC